MRKPTSYIEIVQVLEQLPVLVQYNRRRLDLNLRDAATQSGVPFNAISRVERGQKPSLENAIKLLTWIGTS